MINKIKPIAIYLPQFHPVPENDNWWGKGFTEWTNVTKAKPEFKGHYQPHLPADLGFYDLRLAEARLAQEELAKTYGIHGFCYYHYWFNGKRMLYEPLDKKIQNPSEDLPFMLCWANENWTRVWDGSEREILLKQEYSEEDDVNHINQLISYFKDDRYIKVDGKPIFIIYRLKLFPDLENTIKTWREEVKKAGFPDLYLGFSQNYDLQFEPTTKGFDFAFEFQPNFGRLPNVYNHNLLKKIKRKVYKKLNKKLVQKTIYNYSEYSKLQMKHPFKPNVFPGITPMWDNTARRKDNAFVLHNSTPADYEKWLLHIRKNYPWDSVPENFLFINAWNEWAEGNHLEPCQKWQHQYLEVTKQILL
ncbi:glycoside hydrolase family 99-like domain-containing protein [Flavobacterium sp. WC2416]|uniref:Glycoside hydrolase family 99-like domain-containing protein n=1 Tax=Flavobacterium sp. WC2416 TaxID=3234141 RepID=A0AB39WAL8_9FLAO